jgi:hypothetical protein
MRTDNGLRLEDQQPASSGAKAIEADKRQAIDIAAGHPLQRSAAQRTSLATKDRDFSWQRCPRSE